MPFPVNNIREVCKERKTSLAEVERALNIGNGVIARWENGKKYPPIDKIKAVADHLKVPVSRLTGETENPPPVGDGLVDKISALAQSPVLLEELNRFLELAAEDPETARRFLAFAVQELQSSRPLR